MPPKPLDSGRGRNGRYSPRVPAQHLHRLGIDHPVAEMARTHSRAFSVSEWDRFDKPTYANKFSGVLRCVPFSHYFQLIVTESVIPISTNKVGNVSRKSAPLTLSQQRVY